MAGTGQGNESAQQAGGVPETGRLAGKDQDQEKKPYESKDEPYFSYYSLLSHQAQMLQDSVRTAAYQRAILGHSDVWFKDKTVIDVGAGNGILSLFSAQAGARKVFAIEASNMVEHLQRLIDAANVPAQPSAASADNSALAAALGTWATPGMTGTNLGSENPRNAWLGKRVQVVHSKVEDVTSEHLGGVSQVDTIVSECLGVLLIHERMCESFIDARTRFLKPGGAVFPSAGTICLAPFEDRALWDETANKARWWQNQNFYGIDVTPFASEAYAEAFSSPVVGCFNPLTLISVSSDYTIDFATVTQSELERFVVPLEWEIRHTAVIHGIGGWFDLHFQPPPAPTPSASATDEIAEAQGRAAAEDVLMSQSQSQSQPSGANSTSAFTSNAAAMRPNPPESTTIDLDIIDAGLPPVSGSGSQPQLLSGDAAAFEPSSLLGMGLGPSSTYMSTSPYSAPTHWQQVRFLLPEPLAVNRGQKVTGQLFCVVNESRSYTLTAELHVEGAGAGAGPGPNANANAKVSDPLLSRNTSWRLDRQTYSWTTSSASTSA